jgi:serine/threonine-protein kinase
MAAPFRHNRDMNACAPRPLEDIASCRGLGERQRKVDLSTGVELQPGHLLDGRFVIGEPICQGGMATIYLAEDKQNGWSKVAVKVPFLRFAQDPAYVARFLREEQIGLKVNHPSLLKFIPVTGKKSRLYLVTEYLAGSTLARLVHQRAPLPEADALKITSLIGDALCHLHEHGYIHRDLKPDNIMLCCDHTIRIMDFGLASPIAGRLDFLADKTPVFGTPQYMAPEQVQRSHSDARTDIYSLGVILYEMLTGQLPFTHKDPWVMAQSRVSGDPAAPRQINPAISPAAEEIILHAMQRKPAARYASVVAFQAELNAPEKVKITGYCTRLRPPRFVLSYEQAQLFYGLVISVVTVVLLLGAFFLLEHLPGKHH